MAPRVVSLLLAIVLGAPASALGSSGGTAIPEAGNGGVHSMPAEPTRLRTVAPAPVGRPAAAAHPPAPVARPAASPPVRARAAAGGGGEVEVPLPQITAPKPAARAPAPAAAVPSAALPSTGLDLGVMAAVGMLMVGAGLLVSASVGPRPRSALRQ
jgi:hypothetical protein